jgi:hypothetical protein
MASLKQARRLLQPKVRKGQTMSEMIIAIIVIVLVVVIAVMLYLRSTSAMSALGTATGSASLASDGSLLLTVSAEGGKITIAGIVLDSPTGVVATVGTTPGYSGPSSPSCGLSAVYIAGSSGSTTAPWVVQNGKSASFTFKPSSTGGCSSVTTILVFYNSGKVLQISVG